MTVRFVGIDVCPYCRGTDTANKEDRCEGDPELLEEGLPDDIICRDVECENCGKEWTVEFRPAHYFTYDGGPKGDEFNREPKTFFPSLEVP